MWKPKIYFSNSVWPFDPKDPKVILRTSCYELSKLSYKQPSKTEDIELKPKIYLY